MEYMKFGIIGYGDARDLAVFYRLKSDAPPGKIVLLLLRRVSYLGDDPLVHFVSDIPSATELLAELGCNFSIVLDPNLLFTDVAKHLKMLGIELIGPDRASAEIEASKKTLKDILINGGVPTPKSIVVRSNIHAQEQLDVALQEMGGNVALKSDRFIADANMRSMLPSSADDARALLEDQLSYVSKTFGSESMVLIEQFILGQELSLHLLWDGDSHIILPPVFDYKRAGDGNTGANTHGAAALAIGGGFSSDWEKILNEQIVDPVIKALKEAGLSYRGFLYIGVILSDTGVKVLEINVRPGNPEILALLGVLASNFYDLMVALANKSLHTSPIEWESSNYSVAVFAMAENYPTQPIPDPVPITGISNHSWSQSLIPQDLKQTPDGFIVDGGRVVAAVATEHSLNKAKDQAYNILKQVEFKGLHFRSDLGSFIPWEIIAHSARPHIANINKDIKQKKAHL